MPMSGEPKTTGHSRGRLLKGGEDKIHRTYSKKTLALNINQLHFAHLPILTHFWPITVPISSGTQAL